MTQREVCRDRNTPELTYIANMQNKIKEITGQKICNCTGYTNKKNANKKKILQRMQQRILPR